MGYHGQGRPLGNVPPHNCTNNCGVRVQNYEEMIVHFSQIERNGKKYFRGICKPCRSKEERERVRINGLKKKMKLVHASPQDYNSCYDCGNVQRNFFKVCRDCKSTNLTPYEEI